MFETQFLQQALGDLKDLWSEETMDDLAQTEVPDTLFGRRRGLLVGDIKGQWARWYVESIVDPRRVFEKQISYPRLYEEVLNSVTLRFLGSDKTISEKQELSSIAADIILLMANAMDTRRDRLNFDERKLLVDLAGKTPRCWICGAAFDETAVDNFLFRRRHQVSLPAFVDVLKPRGLVDRDLQIEVDHVVPVALGGKTRDNLKLACGWCNRHKSAHISIYDVEGSPRTAGPNEVGLHSLPQPFWIVRLLGIARKCEHPGGCTHSVDSSELTIASKQAGGAINPGNLRVTCTQHDRMHEENKRLQPPSIVKAIWKS